MFPLPAAPFTRRKFLLAGMAGLRLRETGMGGARFRVERAGSSARRYLHIHGDETTARDVLEAHLRARGGTAFFILSEERTVPCLDGRLDPNRMFSREGAARNLRRLNPGWSEAQRERALALLDREREPFLRALLPPHGGLLFALHNNSRGYSIRDEIAASSRVSLPRHDQPSDFFLCTHPRDFARLADSPYNVVLQEEPLGEEDGSLSRLAARRRIRYVNLECALGSHDRQAAMLDWADRHLP